jgi:hypothetical protein
VVARPLNCGVRVDPHYVVVTLSAWPTSCFEWDARKNLANQRKHGVSFEETRTAFFDEHA